MGRQDTNAEKAKAIAEKCQIIHGWKRAEAFRECYDSAFMMAEWKDSQPISAETFRACIQMLNDTCYESGTGVDEVDIEYTIKQRRLS